METPTISSSAYGSLSTDAANVRKFLPEPLYKGKPLAEYEKNLPLLSIPPTMTQNFTRIVKVFIADPDENLPLEKRLLYKGDEQLTNLTDQELYFEIPIMSLLKGHNETRTTTKDKKASEKFGKEIYLEPVRVKDLKMVVVNVAMFA